MKGWRGAFLAAALVVVVYHFRLALPGNALVSNDFRSLFIPLRAGLQNTLREGSWPFWQRGMFLGYPMLGDIQFQLFNPLTWLTLPLHPARGITVQSLLELCLCSVGMAFWMKQRGLKAAEAVREAGGEIALVFTMVDREEGATEAFAEAGLQFRSLYKAGEFLKG